MKRAIVLSMLVLAPAFAWAQSDTLRETEYRDPRGTVVVRWGQPPGRPAEPKPSFATLDRNGDGVVDEAEASAYLTLANDFDYADTNHDRRISRREFDRW